MVRAIDTIGLKPVIDTTFELADIAEAFRHQEAGKHFGKVCLSI
jgi:NADPH:quinone reductase-like Zn-dependent oxidoreductase